MIKVVIIDSISNLFTVEFNDSLANALADKVETRLTYEFSPNFVEDKTYTVTGSYYVMKLPVFLNMVKRMTLDED